MNSDDIQSTGARSTDPHLQGNKQAEQTAAKSKGMTERELAEQELGPGAKLDALPPDAVSDAIPPDSKQPLEPTKKDDKCN